MIRIHVCGAAGEVTGSSYLVETERARVLVDCGMFQGTRSAHDDNRDLGPIDPAQLDAVVLTHAHLDHSGRLPLLARGGYTGPVYTTPASADFAALVMRDSARINESDIARINRRRERAGRELIEPLYTEGHVRAVEELFQPTPYDHVREIAPGVTIRLMDAGHILGSASVEMEIRDGSGTKVIAFSGDIGPRDVPILRDPVRPERADLLFLESTYGDRDHQPIDTTIAQFRGVLERSLQEREKVLIPAFAIGRTQLILYVIAGIVREQGVPPFPIYLDSPMAIRATELYEKHRALFDEEAKGLVASHQLRRDLSRLEFLETGAESRALNDRWDSCVVIAGSGMCEGGRIVHHLKHNLWRRGVAVIFVGYAAEGSLARDLIEGATEVRILGQRVVVRADIETLGGFSAHAGRTELLDWAGPVASGGTPIVLTHGEDRQRASLGEGLMERYGVEARRPSRYEVVELG